MDLYGIGFANVRMSTSSNDYTYKYDYRINIFPEEVYLHEFLHTLERTLMDYGYNIPELHDSEKYGYEQENLIGLRQWYQDYMRCNVLDRSTNERIGLDEKVYTFKPAHKSNFQFPMEIEFNKESKSIFYDIKSVADVIKSAI